MKISKLYLLFLSVLVFYQPFCVASTQNQTEPTSFAATPPLLAPSPLPLATTNMPRVPFLWKPSTTIKQLKKLFEKKNVQLDCGVGAASFRSVRIMAIEIYPLDRPGNPNPHSWNSALYGGGKNKYKNYLRLRHVFQYHNQNGRNVTVIVHLGCCRFRKHLQFKNFTVLWGKTTDATGQMTFKFAATISCGVPVDGGTGVDDMSHASFLCVASGEVRIVRYIARASLVEVTPGAAVPNTPMDVESRESNLRDYYAEVARNSTFILRKYAKDPLPAGQSFANNEPHHLDSSFVLTDNSFVRFTTEPLLVAAEVKMFRIANCWQALKHANGLSRLSVMINGAHSRAPASSIGRGLMNAAQYALAKLRNARAAGLTMHRYRAIAGAGSEAAALALVDGDGNLVVDQTHRRFLIPGALKAYLQHAVQSGGWHNHWTRIAATETREEALALIDYLGTSLINTDTYTSNALIDARIAHIKAFRLAELNKALHLATLNPGHNRIYPNKTSCYVGVFRQGQSYRAVISKEGKKINLGSYETDMEGAIAYDRAVLKYKLSTTLLNFPNMVHNLDVEPKSKKCKLSSTGYRGVSEIASGRYYACIYIKRQRQTIGTFDSAIQAALAWDRAAIKRGSKSHTLNFPDGPPINVAPKSKKRRSKKRKSNGEVTASLKVGKEVQVTWGDGKQYAATVEKQFSNGDLKVLFGDNTWDRVKAAMCIIVEQSKRRKRSVSL